MKTKLTFTKLDVQNKYNMINPNEGERLGDYEIQKQITKKWKFKKTSVWDGNGNICHQLQFMKDKERLNILSNKQNYVKNFDNVFNFYQIISSPLLMYRMVCLFESTPICQNNYKSIWDYPLEHIETGKMLIFGEHKGGVNFWMGETDFNELPSTLQNDLKELLLFILSDQIAHPYDNCTAGQIA